MEKSRAGQRHYCEHQKSKTDQKIHPRVWALAFTVEEKEPRHWLIWGKMLSGAIITDYVLSVLSLKKNFHPTIYTIKTVLTETQQK